VIGLNIGRGHAEALIAALAAARKGSRDLEVRIMAAVPGSGSLPHTLFTRSLDAARLLVPAGWDWITGDGPRAGPYAQLDNPVETRPAFEIIVHDAASAPIALCIASLKARLADAAKDEG